MRVGIPTEIKEDENRVAITPSGVAAFKLHGHDVMIQSRAGAGSAIPDAAYEATGATVVAGAAEVWERSELILKVKEPLDGEFAMMRPAQVVFTYLHLAASITLTQQLLDRRVVGIGYEIGAARRRHLAVARCRCRRWPEGYRFRQVPSR